MRVEKREVIFLSQEEVNTWDNFDKILEGIERESEDSDILDLISEIASNMSDLWDKVIGTE